MAAAEWGNNNYTPGQPTTGWDINNTSGGRAATRPAPTPVQQLAQAVTPLVPAARKRLASIPDNPFAVNQNLVSVNRKKNPFLINLIPSADLFGINIP